VRTGIPNIPTMRSIARDALLWQRFAGVTGIGDWLDGRYPQIADDGQLFTGAFAAPLLHDVWFEKIDGRWQAVLSS
jgi:hypothetical protein